MTALARATEYAEWRRSPRGKVVRYDDFDRERVLPLLTLTSLGVQYSFLNQPVQVPELRRELWDLVRTPKPPQLLVRIGYAKPVRRAMPRRPVTAVTF